MITPISPTTAVIDGTTFTSPSVYLLLDSAFAYNDCQVIGSTLTDLLISLNPDEVSSYDYYSDGNSILKPFNYADLNGPLLFSVFSRQCGTTPISACLPIPDAYFPEINIPSQLRDLNPSWKNCRTTGPDIFGLMDPPRVLVPANVLAVPTADPNTLAVFSSASPVASPEPQPAQSTNDAGNPSMLSNPRPKNEQPEHPPVRDPSPPKNIDEKWPASGSAAIGVPVKVPFADDPPTKYSSSKGLAAEDPWPKGNDLLPNDSPANSSLAYNNLHAEDLPDMVNSLDDPSTKIWPTDSLFSSGNHPIT